MQSCNVHKYILVWCCKTAFLENSSLAIPGCMCTSHDQPYACILVERIFEHGCTCILYGLVVFSIVFMIIIMNGRSM